MKMPQAPDAFVPVRIEPSALPTTAPTAAGLSPSQSRHRPESALMRVQVRLPNGVTVDLGEAGLPLMNGTYAVPGKVLATPNSRLWPWR